MMFQGQVYIGMQMIGQFHWDIIMKNIDSHHYTPVKEEEINLLDLVLPSATADTNIHTFCEFKEWINASFNVKTQLNTASYMKKNDHLVRSIKVKQAKSLSDATDKNLLKTVQRRPSQTFQGLVLIQEGKEGESYMTQSKKMSRQNSNSDLGFQLAQNSIVGSKSAHSSRSFHGYTQINQYELRKLLGKGAFAQVYLAYDTSSSDNKKYAVKILQSKQIKKKLMLRKGSQMLDSEQEKDEGEEVTSLTKPKQSLASLFVRNEVAILKKMDYQYITKLYDVIVDNQNSKVYLVLQFCEGGFINQSKEEKGMYRKLLESECRRYYKQICLAIQYIHNVAKIAHRDIKPENLLLNHLDQVKISDFGLGTHRLNGKKQSGTPLYMPPQSLNVQGQFSSQGGDIWGLGVTLLALLKGKHPEFIEQKINVQKQLSELKDISEECKQFIRGCLQVDVQKRLKASQLVEHVWLDAKQMQLSLRLSNPYSIEISPADELNIFKHIQKSFEVNVVKMKDE